MLKLPFRHDCEYCNILKDASYGKPGPQPILPLIFAKIVKGDPRGSPNAMARSCNIPIAKSPFVT